MGLPLEPGCQTLLSENDDCSARATGVGDEKNVALQISIIWPSCRRVNAGFFIFSDNDAGLDGTAAISKHGIVDSGHRALGVNRKPAAAPRDAQKSCQAGSKGPAESID